MNATTIEVERETHVSSSTAKRTNWIERLDATPRRYRVLIVAVLIVALELIVFRSFFGGRIVPPWDFVGPYNTEAYQWWQLGSFFSPREWVSNAWAGYPSALNLQNSAWYLPVGLASALTPFTIHASAIVSAMHVGLGALGTYFLLRAFKIQFPIAVLGMVASFFAVGYYSNAQHVDIVRGYAWVPWLLLVMAPNFPWRRLWSIPFASLIIWQAVTGIYPGMTIAFVYIAVFWVATYQLMYRPPVRQYLLPLAVSAIVAGLLSMPRLLPYVFLQGNVAGSLPESSAINNAVLGTMIYGYSGEVRPGFVGEHLIGDISMRSLFIPSTMLVLACFAAWRHPITKFAFALLIPALVLGMPGFVWSDAVQNLPGLGFSRFGLSDFKPFMVLAVVMLACSGATNLAAHRADVRLPRRLWAALGGAVALLGVFALLAKVGPYTNDDRISPYILLCIAFALVALYFVPALRRWQFSAVALISAMTILTAVTGTIWAFATEDPWRFDRLSAEQRVFYAPVGALIAQRTEPGELTQRAARIPLPEDAYPALLQDTYWNRFAYTNQDAIGSYMNLKGSETQVLLEKGLVDKNGPTEFADFVAAAGTALTVERGQTPSDDDYEVCAESGECGAALVTPVSYTPGHLTYTFSSPEELDAIFNEAYYPGWVATACTDGSCEELAVSRSSQGLVSVEVPQGDYELRLDYVVRGAPASWVLFWAGVALALASAAWIAYRARRARNDEPRSDEHRIDEHRTDPNSAPHVF